MQSLTKPLAAVVIAACGVLSASQAFAAERCWTETETRTVQKDHHVAGAVAGAVVGGVLGHQIGHGGGRELATAGGALGGAAVGNKVGENHPAEKTETVKVRKCAPA